MHHWRALLLFHETQLQATNCGAIDSKCSAAFVDCASFNLTLLNKKAKTSTTTTTTTVTKAIKSSQQQSTTTTTATTTCPANEHAMSERLKCCQVNEPAMTSCCSGTLGRRSAFSANRRRRRWPLRHKLPAQPQQRLAGVLSTAALTLSAVLLAASVCAHAVVVSQVRFSVLTTSNNNASDNNNNAQQQQHNHNQLDYALVGQSASLSCQTLMQDKLEDVKQVIWSKDGKNIVRWRKASVGIEVLSYAFKGHIDSSSSSLNLVVNNMTIAMHGYYKCSVKTELGFADADAKTLVTVISSDACSLNSSWRVSSNESECRETLRLDCRKMFPKPAPSCGIFDMQRSKLLMAVLVDISADDDVILEPHAAAIQTWRVRYENSLRTIGVDSSSPFSLLRNYPSRLEFRCNLSVPQTSWRLSFSHRLFDYRDACDQNPLEFVESLRANYTQFVAAAVKRAALFGKRFSIHDADANGDDGDETNNGNSVDNSNSNSNSNEFEMLSSKLRYEYLPAVSGANSQSAPQLTSVNAQTAARQLALAEKQQQQPSVKLNCFGKPKIGTRVRLSCESTTSAHLVGAHALECQASGKWALVDKQKQSRRQWRRVQTSDELLAASQSVKELGFVELSNTHISATQTTKQQVSGGSSNNKPTIDKLSKAGAELRDIARLLPTCVSNIRKLTTSNNSNKLTQEKHTATPTQRNSQGGGSLRALIASSTSSSSSLSLILVGRSISVTSALFLMLFLRSLL